MQQFTSHPAICHTLYEDEEDCLRHLQKLEVDAAENIKSGYSIKLYFNENLYFKNEVLEKEFFYKQGKQNLCKKVFRSQGYLKVTSCHIN